MRSLPITLLLACAGAHAATTTTATPVWDLYSGSTKVATFASSSECVDGARARAASQGLLGSFAFACSASTKVVVTVAADPPPAVAPVAIITQPLSATVLEGMPVLLVVSATGGAPLSYQWYKNGAPIGLGGGLVPAGPTYGLTFAALTDAGVYTVSVRNSVGSVTSQPAIVVVQPKQPPPPPPPPPPPGGSALLTWDPPTWKANGIDPVDVAGGYVIRYGHQSGQYAASQAAKTSPAVVTGLGPGTWYFSVTAVDAAGNESQTGYELSKPISP